MTKSDKLGIYATVEKLSVSIYELLIAAALSPVPEKSVILKNTRIKIEVLKRLIRLMFELKIITSSKYFSLQTDLQEISKMATGWQNFLNPKEPKL